MASAASASRRHSGARVLLVCGSLLVASGLLFPWLIAGIAGAACGVHTCVPTGPIITAVSGWRLLDGGGSADAHVMNYSYLALVPVFVGLVLLGIALAGLVYPLPRLLMRAVLALAIAGALILAVETVIVMTGAASNDTAITEALPATLVMFGGFVLAIAGILRLLFHRPRMTGWRKAA